MEDNRRGDNVVSNQNAIDNAIIELNTDLPAFIKTYDHTTQTATVTIGVLEPDGNGGYLDRLEIKEVKCRVNASDSTHYLHFPLKEGTGGNIKFVDCDLEGYLFGNGTPQQIIDDERHDEKDFYFVAGFFPNQDALEDTHAENMILRHGNMKLTFDDSGKMTLEGASNEVMAVVAEYMAKSIDAIRALETSVYILNIGALTGVMNPASITALEAKIVFMETAKGKLEALTI